jgi:palmitoyltransferase
VRGEWQAQSPAPTSGVPALQAPTAEKSHDMTREADTTSTRDTLAAKDTQRAAANNIERIVHSPAPIRVWVYRALLAEHRLWQQWERPVHAAMDDDSDSERRARPYLQRLRLGCIPYATHFNNPGYIVEDMMRKVEQKVMRKTLEETRTVVERREELGRAWEFWDDMAGVLKCAIPSLERRCFAAPDPAAPEYEGLSGPLIASWSPTLLPDLERLNHVVGIARNVLVVGETVQNLCAERLFDKDIFALINVCARVTARGYDGEAGTPDEDKWQVVINACRPHIVWRRGMS